MRKLSIVCVLACGCGGIAESIVGAIVGEFFPATVYEPSEETRTASRLAFVTHGEGGVHCYILGGGSDPVMSVSARPTAIAVGTSGALFVGTDEGMLGLDAGWTEALNLPVPVTTIDDVAADAGTVVVAGRTGQGAVVVVIDEMSGAVIGVSEPQPDVTIDDVAVVDGTAFAIEGPAGDVVSFDLATPVPARVPVATAVPAVALVAVDSWSLLVATSDARIEEMDAATGEVGNTVFSWDPALQPLDLAFDRKSDQILLLTDDDVVRVIDDGRVVETRASPVVRDATGIAFRGR